MKKFVQLDANNIVVSIISSEVEPSLPGVTFIDITKIKTTPEILWMYNSETKKFSAPPLVESETEPVIPIEEKISNDNYKEKRKLLYPPIEDQIESIINVLTHLKNSNVDIGPDGASLLKTIADIKTAHPKFKSK